MKEYGFTPYFINEVLRKRPYLKKEWCFKIIENPLKVEKQENNRIRSWGQLSEFGGKILCVVTPEDGITIHNAFFDRGFKK
jgi:hypothetical protein